MFQLGMVTYNVAKDWDIETIIAKLDALIRNRGRVLTRNQLIEAAWGHGIAITDRAVDTHVFNLRRKIEAVPSQPAFLVGVRGIGYRFESER